MSETIVERHLQKHELLTTKYMSRYEQALVLGKRANEINMGAIVMVKLRENDTDAYFIAMRELEVFF